MTARSAVFSAIGSEADLSLAAMEEIAKMLRSMLGDVFSLYVKTKNFHWHITGRNFRDYYLLLDKQAEQIFAMADDIAERARRIGGSTLRSIGHIARRQRLKDSDEERLGPRNMLLELRDDNSRLARFLRAAHEICGRHNDVATTSLIETWIDQTERRTWFLTEIVSEF
jgi:starvation-inducible DNA-binding protein